MGEIAASVESIMTIGPDMDLQELLTTFFNTAIIFSAVVATVFLIYGGFKYMTSGGDTSRTEEAQKSISSVVIGLIVVLTSGIVVRFVLQLLKVDADWI